MTRPLSELEQTDDFADATSGLKPTTSPRCSRSSATTPSTT